MSQIGWALFAIVDAIVDVVVGPFCKMAETEQMVEWPSNQGVIGEVTRCWDCNLTSLCLPDPKVKAAN